MLAAVSRSGRRPRRWAALGLLVAYSASTGEATTGLLRDGSVHHESSVSAAAHQETSRGDHGHEDPGAGAEHGSDHRHGTSGDHCTHVHGLGLPSGCAIVAIMIRDETPVEAVPLTPAGTSLRSQFRPPKA
jgi:hypothetical protein